VLAHITGIPHHPEELNFALQLCSMLSLFVGCLINSIFNTKKHNRKKNIMPCDTVQTMKVEIGKLDNLLAQKAILELERMRKIRQGTVQYSDGRLIMQGGMDASSVTALVKQAYAAQVVESQAKRFGWSLKKVSDFKYQVTRR